VVPLDAEDIAMARLQAHLRKTETIRVPSRRRTPLSRTTLRLPREMLQRVRDQARREGATISKVVEVALERYLRLA
jgi:predicted DNA binding CopG/RHH family protein